MTTDLRSAPREAYASWGRRVAASLVDVVVLLVLVSAPFLGVAALLLPLSQGLAIGVAVLAYVATVVFAVDQLVKQGKRGATVGKWLLGLRLVDGRSGQPVGVVRSLVRPFAHVLDGLPLYAGYLAPLFTSRKQTFADKAQDTVVLRVPAPPRSALVPAALLLPAAAVMIAASTVVLGELDGVRPEESTTAPAAPDAAAPQDVAPEPDGSVLAPEDLEGRLAPTPDGFRPVDDAQAGLGALDVEQTAALSAETPEQVQAAAAGLRDLGLVEAFARGYEADGRLYFALVYRFADPQGALEFTRVIAESEQTRPTPVPEAVVYDPGGDATVPSGLFARGAYAYELSVLREPGQATDADLTPLLQRQYEFASRLDG